MRRRSFRFRVALHFAGFGALVSLLLCLGVYVYAHDMGRRLIDETLLAEMQDYFARQAHNPLAPLPATLALSGYVLDGGVHDAAVPSELRRLSAGRHDILLDGVARRVLASERAGKRYLFLFDESLQNQREREFLWFLGLGALAMTLLSALGGFWLARRIVAPVATLAARVAAAGPEAVAGMAAQEAKLDEVEELALVFDRYLARIQSCIKREHDFTANVSHELRTPLAIIRGAVEVLEEDTALNPAQRGRLARIERASRDMTQLTNVLLHLAREENAPHMDNEGCDLAEVVRDSVEKCLALACDRSLDIRLDIPPEFPLPAARILAAVVVDNLIGNACHHAGTARIEISLDPARLAIRDSGGGIAAHDLEQVFERHYRSAQSTGAGIGLALVKRICELNGWAIRLESAPGQGTTVSLAFPGPDAPVAQEAP